MSPRTYYQSFKKSITDTIEENALRIMDQFDSQRVVGLDQTNARRLTSIYETLTIIGKSIGKCTKNGTREIKSYLLIFINVNPKLNNKTNGITQRTLLQSTNENNKN